MFKIEIPKPCHADWNEMTPTQKGAFCSFCSKEVVDFTQMSDEEVQNYFLIHSNRKTCGHFRTDQLHRIRIQLPENIFLQKIAGWKKFMAVVLLAFGTMLFGCDVGVDRTTNGELKIVHTEVKLTSDTMLAKGRSVIDLVTPPNVPPLLGAVTAIIQDSILGNELTEDIQPTVEGQIEMVPIDTMDPKTNSSISPLVNHTLTGDTIISSCLKIKDTLNKKPVSDSGKCHDTGFY